MSKIIISLVVTIAAYGGTLWAQCEVPPEIRQILAKPVMQRKIVESQADKDARAAVIKEALAAHPDDYFLLRNQLMAIEDKEEKLRYAREMRKQHSDNPVYAVLEADALLGKDTPAAIRLIEEVKAAHPEMILNLPLARAVSIGKFKDKAKIQKELDGYIKSCSNSISLDGVFLPLVLQSGTPEQVSWTAATLRKRLETDINEIRTSPWEALWNLEFKAHPITEHSDVRVKIAGDLKQMEKSPRRQELAWMLLLLSGYQSVGDEAAVERLNHDILKTHPKSAEAGQIMRKQWSEKQPPPNMNDKAAVEAYARSSITANREWFRIRPDDSHILHDIFYSLTKLPDTTAEQMTAAIDEFLAAYKKGSDWMTRPPIEFRIAEAYIQYKTRLDQVPSLVNESYRAEAKSLESTLTDDRIDDQARTTLRNSLEYTHIDAAHLLLDYYQETKQPLKAREVLAELASIDTSKPPQNWEMLSLQAQAAEIEGRKPDALMLYRTAVENRGPIPPKYEENNKLSQNMLRLWKEMGGTQEGLQGLSSTAVKKKNTESTEGHWERSKSSLSSFSLKDTKARSWSLVGLGGKALLINVWATWCAPCVAEHPEFQKLYDKLKNRADFAVLSFNMDEDIGKVAPYIAKHHYTFPVIPARDLVNSIKPSIILPQNWLVNPKGKLEWEQIGYSSEETDWQDKVIAKMEQLLKP